MALNDELYSRLVNLYQGLDDQEIHQLNARLILLLSEKVSDSVAIRKIINRLEAENKNAKKLISAYKNYTSKVVSRTQTPLHPVE